MTRIADLAGKRFNRLTVISQDPSRNEHTYWKCRCDCGNETVVDAHCIKTGTTKSCGCLNSELIKTRSTTHGMSYTPEFSVWAGIKRRCYNTNEKCYPRYGGRGITVCDRWINSFSNFFTDMGERPSKDHSIERRDNKGIYSPDNCYWATREEQCSNRRSNVFITHEGRTQTLTQWAKEIGIQRTTLNYRIRIANWSIHDAITTPVKFILSS